MDSDKTCTITGGHFHRNRKCYNIDKNIIIIEKMELLYNDVLNYILNFFKSRRFNIFNASIKTILQFNKQNKFP